MKNFPVEFPGHGPLDLGIFCSPDSGPLSEPVSRGDYTYACNGHLIVRVARLAQFTKEPTFDINRVIYEPPLQRFGSWRPLPAYTLPAKVKCHACKGAKFTTPCPDCEGEGEVHWVVGCHEYEDECRECRGSGRLSGGTKECEYCTGSGEVYPNPPASVIVEATRLNILLLEKLQALPGVELFLPTDEKMMVPFRFAFGDGCLMAMRRD